MKAYFTELPEKIKYMMQNDGHADVWLRKNIAECSQDTDEITELKSIGYSADEVYLNTRLSYDQIEEQFDDLFEHGAPEIEEISLEERVDALEEVILELFGGE